MLSYQAQDPCERGDVGKGTFIFVLFVTSCLEPSGLNSNFFTSVGLYLQKDGSPKTLILISILNLGAPSSCGFLSQVTIQLGTSLWVVSHQTA